MATSLFQKILKNQSRYVAISRKLTTTSAAATTTTTTTTNLLSSNHQFQKLDEPNIQNPIFLHPSNSFAIYPSFSFEHFLNPVAPFAPDSEIISEVDGIDLGEEGEKTNMIWADSVKKKRKRKMNKHKLKKLRKRLRRKT